MTAIVICLVAFAASALTFFSGFGLGTLLLPAFALFYPIEVAVASTAVVHFLNSLFKLALVGRHADRPTVLRFGIPAIVAALLGAWLLAALVTTGPIASWSAFGARFDITPAKLAVGVLLLIVTVLELSPRHAQVALPTHLVPLGGALSGFFGGVSGMQGALRTAFLIRLGLSREAFIGTGVVVAALVDLSRLAVYARSVIAERAGIDAGLLAAAVAAAFLGALLGNRLLRKVTLPALHRFVGVMLMLVAVALIGGIL